jgi:hypothetical protein
MASVIKSRVGQLPDPAFLSAVLLDPVLQLADPMLAGTVGTAIEFSVSNLHAVPDDHAAAMGAPRCQGMDRTFEAVEYVLLVTYHHRK